MKNVKHGESIRTEGSTRVSKLYTVWQNMVRRCIEYTMHQYKDYGGRGITVCDEWRDSTNFFLWAKSHGYKEGLQLDRINNDGNYEPENCRFVTRSQNCINKRKREDYNIYPRYHSFRVKIKREGHQLFLKTYSTIEEARYARDEYINKINNKYE